MSKIVIANHKNYMITNDINEYIKNINDKIKSKNVIICPSNIYIPYFLKQKYSVGIQNVCLNDLVCTGEINSLQAIKIGIKYVILGHSERRNIFNENNDLINQKIKDSLKNNIKVILCIGETLEQKNFFQTKKILKDQLKKSLKEITDLKNIVVAYEPIWAIGTNLIPENSEIEEITIYIKEVIKELFDYDNIPVLYGGSVKANNIEKLNEINELNGFLVGKASTDYKEFLKIIEVVML